MVELSTPGYVVNSNHTNITWVVCTTSAVNICPRKYLAFFTITRPLPPLCVEMLN